MKKLIILLGFLFSLFTSSNAQVEKNIVLEHFTNTRCGVCASRNPGLFTNLENHPNVMHIAVHPSKPYNICELYKHNPAENDSRTNYYNILGGTPRIVIQGTVISSGTNYGSGTIFDPYESKTSPFSVTATTLKSDMDSFIAQVVIKTEATHSYSSLQLYVPAVEDTLKYNAPNGENEHYNVFRKILLDETVSNPPSTIGDSLIYTVRSARNSDWDNEQMYALAILQDPSNKEIVQAGKSDVIKEQKVSSVKRKLDNRLVSVSPNPFDNEITVKLKEIQKGTITITNTVGQTVLNQEISGQLRISTQDFPSGVYLLTLESEGATLTRKIIK